MACSETKLKYDNRDHFWSKFVQEPNCSKREVLLYTGVSPGANVSLGSGADPGAGKSYGVTSRGTVALFEKRKKFRVKATEEDTDSRAGR